MKEFLTTSVPWVYPAWAFLFCVLANVIQTITRLVVRKVKPTQIPLTTWLLWLWASLSPLIQVVALFVDIVPDKKRPLPILCRLLDPTMKPEKHGDLYDLKAHSLLSVRGGDVQSNAIGLVYKAGARFTVSLGVAMQAPEGFRFNMPPRSSTEKKFGVILANSIGIIDEEYAGNDDIWLAHFVAVADGEMHWGDRVVQFELVEKAPDSHLVLLDKLPAPNRGGHGSTGH